MGVDIIVARTTVDPDDPSEPLMAMQFSDEAVQTLGGETVLIAAVASAVSMAVSMAKHPISTPLSAMFTKEVAQRGGLEADPAASALSEADLAELLAKAGE